MSVSSCFLKVGADSTRILFQIGISVESRAVCAEEFLSLLKADFPLLHALGNPCLQLPYEFLGIILHVVKHLLNGLAIDNLVDVVFAVLDRDVYGIGVAEEVVHVAENFLICSDEEHSKVVVLVFPQGVYGQYVLDVAVGNEVRDLSV